MKVVILHPPLYPVNDRFFNFLGQYVDLTVYSFGEKPGLHDWTIDKNKKNYKLKILAGHTDLKKYAVSYKTQFKIEWIKDIVRDKPDIVLSVAFWIPSLYASLLKKFLGYKFLIVTDAIWETEKNISNTRKYIRKLICHNTDTVISASALTTDYLREICINTPIVHSLQTIDIEEWMSSFNQLPDKHILRKELGIPESKTILLGVGGFTEKKNWMAVFRQMEHLDNCHFVLVGFGEEEERYKNYIKDKSLEDRIELVSRKEGKELIKYFKMSDIFIFPSLSDTFGYVVLEALLSGLPVICSEKSGASSLIVNTKNGFVVDPYSNFTKEIELTINNLKKMSIEADVTMKNKTLKNKAKEYIEIFKSAGK